VGWIPWSTGYETIGRACPGSRAFPFVYSWRDVVSLVRILGAGPIFMGSYSIAECVGRIERDVHRVVRSDPAVRLGLFGARSVPLSAVCSVVCVGE
jgi:hypothetical protein